MVSTRCGAVGKQKMLPFAIFRRVRGKEICIFKSRAEEQAVHGAAGSVAWEGSVSGKAAE